MQHPCRHNNHPILHPPNYQHQQSTSTHPQQISLQEADTTIAPRDSAYLRSICPPVPYGSQLPNTTVLSTSVHALLSQRSDTTGAQTLESFFARDKLPTSVQIQLNRTFGKDSLSRSFYAEKRFRHIILPVLKSGYLSCRSTKNLEKAAFRVRQLQ